MLDDETFELMDKLAENNFCMHGEEYQKQFLAIKFMQDTEFQFEKKAIEMEIENEKKKRSLMIEQLLEENETEFEKTIEKTIKQDFEKSTTASTGNYKINALAFFANSPLKRHFRSPIAQSTADEKINN